MKGNANTIVIAIVVIAAITIGFYMGRLDRPEGDGVATESIKINIDDTVTEKLMETSDESKDAISDSKAEVGKIEKPVQEKEKSSQPVLEPPPLP
jgi:hypothetical protein